MEIERRFNAMKIIRKRWAIALLGVVVLGLASCSRRGEEADLRPSVKIAYLPITRASGFRNGGSVGERRRLKRRIGKVWLLAGTARRVKFRTRRRGFDLDRASDESEGTRRRAQSGRAWAPRRKRRDRFESDRVGRRPERKDRRDSASSVVALYFNVGSAGDRRT